MSAWTRAVVAAVWAAVAVALAGCGGAARPAPPTVLSSTANATATATTPARPAFIATATPDVQEPAPPCRLEDLQVASRGPVGATAMMSFGLGIANRGAAPCSLPPPASVRFLDPADGRLLAASNPGNRTFAPITLQPTRALGTVDVNSPEGSGYIWMLWSWRAGADGACVVYDPPLVTVVATCPEFQLEAPAPIKLGPCSGQVGIAGFALVPSRD